MANQPLKKGRTTDILRRSVGQERLQAILAAHDGIREIERKQDRTPPYRGRKVETPGGETQLKGKGMPEHAGQLFAQIITRLYGLQKEEYLSGKEVHQIEAIMSRGISRRTPRQRPPVARRGTPPDRAFNFLVYLLYVNIKRALHIDPFGLTAEVITEQELETTYSLDYKALYDRYRRAKRDHPRRWYDRIRADHPEASLPPWESLLHSG